MLSKPLFLISAAKSQGRFVDLVRVELHAANLLHCAEIHGPNLGGDCDLVSIMNSELSKAHSEDWLTP